MPVCSGCGAELTANGVIHNRVWVTGTIKDPPELPGLTRYTPGYWRDCIYFLSLEARYQKLVDAIRVANLDGCKCSICTNFQKVLEEVGEL